MTLTQDEADPDKVSDTMVCLVSESRLAEEQIIGSFLSNVCSQNRFAVHLPEVIIRRDLPKVSGHYQNKMYQSLQWTFWPWVCLMELDTVVTVSFCGYEELRRIEFYDEEAKYKKGFFYNRMELSRLSKDLRLWQY